MRKQIGDWAVAGGTAVDAGGIVWAAPEPPDQVASVSAKTAATE